MAGRHPAREYGVGDKSIIIGSTGYEIRRLLQAQSFKLPPISIRQLLRCFSPEHLKAGSKIISGPAISGGLHIGSKGAPSDLFQAGLA